MPPDSTNDDRKGERIAKLLARAGIASRREVERMIAEGRVKLGDEVVTTPATVLETLRGITVDGKPVKAPEPPRLFAFHKPDGLITAERDPTGRPTIYTALRNALPEGTPRLMPVGRLDLNTEGLLLLTNDGELKRAMELPSSGIPRTYRARTFGDVSQNRLEELIEGVTIEGMNYGRIDANMERSAGRNKWIELTLTEGKNREVRRVLEYLGLQVSRLLRTRYGPFYLDELQRGSAVEIRQKDVEQFRRTFKLALGKDGETAATVSSPRESAPGRAPGRVGNRTANRVGTRPDARKALETSAPTGTPTKTVNPRKAPFKTDTGPRRSPFGRSSAGESPKGDQSRERPARAESRRGGPAKGEIAREDPPRGRSSRGRAPQGGSPGGRPERGGPPKAGAPRGGPPNAGAPRGGPRGPRK